MTNNPSPPSKNLRAALDAVQKFNRKGITLAPIKPSTGMIEKAVIATGLTPDVLQAAYEVMLAHAFTTAGTVQEDLHDIMAHLGADGKNH